eukprot:SAG11_NODE_81_length_17673_cov_7.702572_8_plen_86_part_00
MSISDLLTYLVGTHGAANPICKYYMEVIINSDKMLCREHDKGMEKKLDLFLTKHSTVYQYCTGKFRYDKNLDPFFTIRSIVKSIL